MAIDQTKIGLAAANLMQQLEEAYGDDAEIETVMVIAAVDHGMQNTIHFGASPGTSSHVGRGMLLSVQDGLARRQLDSS